MEGSKVIVAVVVYDRVNNIRRWINAWNKRTDQDALLIVIHNNDARNRVTAEQIKGLCTNVKNCVYFPRENRGMDIGAMQDFFTSKIMWSYDWDWVLWCTDDTFPMTPDFIERYQEVMERPGVGVAAMKISQSVAPHVRTTGFAIWREVARQITFPADPILTKQQCYLFEHKGGMATMTMQVRRLGYDCVQVDRDEVAPMFDIGYHKALPRLSEHNRVFYGSGGSGDMITFICTIYNTYPQVVSALKLQTHKNWRLILVNDGPFTDEMRNWAMNLCEDDERIQFTWTEERRQNYGHPNRRMMLEFISDGGIPMPDYIHIGNADNYYVPTFCESMLREMEKHPNAVAAFCNEMVHSYVNWRVMPVKLQRGHVDVAGVIVRSHAALAVGWPSYEHSSDWTYIEQIGKMFSFDNFVRVSGCLFVHN